MVTATSEPGRNTAGEGEWYILQCTDSGHVSTEGKMTDAKREHTDMCVSLSGQLACPFPSWWMYNRESWREKWMRERRQKWCMGLETWGVRKMSRQVHYVLLGFFLLVVTKPNQGLISKHAFKKRERCQCGFQKMCRVGQRFVTKRFIHDQLAHPLRFMTKDNLTHLLNDTLTQYKEITSH